MLNNARASAFQSDLTKLSHEIDLKNQEIRMLRAYQQHYMNTSSIQSDCNNLNIGKLKILLINIAYKEKYEELLKSHTSLNYEISMLKDEISKKDDSLNKFEVSQYL